jgi:hypothetical protein
MRDAVTICDLSELALAQGAGLDFVLRRDLQFNPSATIAAQNARLGRRSARRQASGRTGESGVAMLRARPNMAAVE